MDSLEVVVSEPNEPLLWAPQGPEEQKKRRRNPLPAPTRPRRQLVVELVLLFLLAFAPALLGVAATATGAAPAETTGDQTLGQAVSSMAIVVVITWLPVGVLAYRLLQNREGFGAIGLTRPRLRDLGATAWLWPASFAVVLLLTPIFSQFGTNQVEFLDLSLPLWWLLMQSLLTSLTAGFTEEILVRGYAQTRLEQFRLPRAVIVALPTAFWAVLHVYQGLGAALTIFGLGLLYAVYFHRTRRLWPLIAAHTLFDLTVLSITMAQA